MVPRLCLSSVTAALPVPAPPLDSGGLIGCDRSRVGGRAYRRKVPDSLRLPAAPAHRTSLTRRTALGHPAPGGDTTPAGRLDRAPRRRPVARLAHLLHAAHPARRAPRERAGPRAVLRRPARLARHAVRGSRRRAGADRHLRSRRRGDDVAGQARLSRCRRDAGSCTSRPTAGWHGSREQPVARGSTRASRSPASSTSTAWARAGPAARPARDLPAALEHAARSRPGLRHGACRCSCRIAATRLFFDNSERRAARGRPLGQRGPHRLHGRRRAPLTWYFLIGRDLRGVMRGGRRAAGPGPAARRAGRSASSSRPVTSTTPPSCRRCRARSARSASRATGSIYLSTYGEALGWNRGVGHLEFQPELWPDPAALLDEARDQHFEVITHEYPVLHENSPLFAEAEARGYLLAGGLRARRGDRPRARDLPRGPALPRLLQPGRARRGGGRPIATCASSAWPAGGSTAARARRRAPQLHAGDGTLLHNFYDRLRHQAFAEGEAADRPDQRVFLLCRSGAAGMQRLRRARAGRATSTTTSRRSKRRSRSG